MATSFLFVWNPKLKLFYHSSLKLSSKKYCSCNTKKTCVVLVLRLALRLVKMSRMDSWSYLQYLKTPTIYLFEICRCSYLYLLYLYLHRSYIFRFTKDFLDLYIQVYFWLVDDHIFLIYIFVLIFFFLFSINDMMYEI